MSWNLSWARITSGIEGLPASDGAAELALVDSDNKAACNWWNRNG
jgi:hypothetical protein